MIEIRGALENAESGAKIARAADFGLRAEMTQTLTRIDQSAADRHEGSAARAIGVAQRERQ